MGERRLVLVADGDPITCSRLADLLADVCDVDTIRTTDGAEALKEWALRAPDALVLAPALPLIDGAEVARRSGGAGGRPRVPVVFTGAVAAGVCQADDVALTPPVDPDRLCAAVRRALGG